MFSEREKFKLFALMETKLKGKGDRQWGQTGVYYVPVAVQYIYGWSDEGEDGDGKDGGESPRGWEKVEIA